MKKLLVPIDFSENARGALQFARALGEFIGPISITVAHVYTPDIEPDYPNFVPPVEEFLRIRESLLTDFVAEVQQEDPTVPLTELLLIGFPVDEIRKISKEYDLIVMGTTGSGGLLGQLFGSVSTAVSKKANCPVMLVPKGLKFNGFRHILYASSYDSAAEEMVKKLLAFNQFFTANIHFVHVRTKKDKGFEGLRESLFERLFSEGDLPFAFEMEEISSQSVTEGLDNYARRAGIDLVVMVHRTRGFWDQFFRKSQTQQLALGTHLPLIVFHLDQEETANAPSQTKSKQR